jgi:hypothetical protein
MLPNRDVGKNCGTNFRNREKRSDRLLRSGVLCPQRRKKNGQKLGEFVMA